MPLTRRVATTTASLALLGAIATSGAHAQGTVNGSTTSSTSAIAVISWSPGPHIRVYRSDGNRVTESGYDGNGPWYVGGLSVPGEEVAATSWTDTTIHIRVYVVSNGVTTEYGWDANGPWYKGGFK
jgi:hypothetical protein